MPCLLCSLSPPSSCLAHLISAFISSTWMSPGSRVRVASLFLVASFNPLCRSSSILEWHSSQGLLLDERLLLPLVCLSQLETLPYRLSLFLPLLLSPLHLLPFSLVSPYPLECVQATGTESHHHTEEGDGHLQDPVRGSGW